MIAVEAQLPAFAVRDLLVASHILPWSSNPQYRLCVSNGLCLSRLHDAAFDLHLIGFDEELRLILSKELKNALQQRSIAENFGAYVGERLSITDDAVAPNMEFLAIHRSKVSL